MSWPTTGAGFTGNIIAQGVSTVRWGSRELVTSMGGTDATAGGTISGGTTQDGISVGIVLNITQKQLIENFKLTNGDGFSTTRIQLIDGHQWDVTIRDDSTIGVPSGGTVVVIVDMLGSIGGYSSGAGKKYEATVVETSYSTAPKEDGKRTFTVENLKLIEYQTAK